MKATNRKSKIRYAAAVFALAMLFGCTNSPAGSQSSADTQPSAQAAAAASGTSAPAETEPAREDPDFTITIGLPQEIPDSPTVTEAIGLMEQYSGVNLDIFYYGGGDNFPILLASGDLPMAISSPGSHMTRSHVIDGMADGMFWDLTDDIPNYKNLASLNEVTYVTFSSGGRIFGIPRERNIGREGVGYRRDWAKELGIGDADGNLKTFDDLYQFMLAVPEKKGVYAQGDSPLNYFSVWFTGVYQWKYEDGEMKPRCFYPGHMEALDICRELYAKGAIYPEFPILAQDELDRMWREGELAIRVGKTDFASDTFADPNADIGVNGAFPTKNGTYTMGAVGHNGGFFIPKSTVKDEETVQRILKFFDGMGNQDMATLFQYGIEGKHYNVVNGNAVINMDTDVRTDYTNNILKVFKNALATLDPTSRSIPTEYTYLQKRNIDVMEENAEYAVFSDTSGLVSQTYNERGADLNTILDDAEVRYVMGAIDKAGYEAEVEKWRAMGGDTACEEFAEAYRTAHHIS